MNSCFIQYNAPLENYVDVPQKINLFSQKQLLFCQLQKNFVIFEIQIFSVTVHDIIQLVGIGSEVYTYFSTSFIYCPL